MPLPEQGNVGKTVVMPPLPAQPPKHRDPRGIPDRDMGEQVSQQSGGVFLVQHRYGGIGRLP